LEVGQRSYWSFFGWQGVADILQEAGHAIRFANVQLIKYQWLNWPPHQAKSRVVNSLTRISLGFGGGRV